MANLRHLDWQRPPSFRRLERGARGTPPSWRRFGRRPPMAILVVGASLPAQLMVTSPGLPANLAA